NAVIPILGDKRLNPWVVVAVEDGFLGAAHDQTVELYKLCMVNCSGAAAEIREREIRSALVEREIGHDSKREIGRQGNDPIEDVRIVRLLDGNREVAREERAIVIVIAQNLPFEISEHRRELQD